jgi:secreted Zn-dependent insulinase-like peptidase
MSTPACMLAACMIFTAGFTIQHLLSWLTREHAAVLIQGFTSILPRLLRCVLEGLQELGSLSHISDEASAAQRSTESHDASHQGASDFGLAVGKLMQLVKHHAHKSPAEHAAYEAESLLQEPHWHATHDVLPFLLHQYGSSNGRPAAGGADVAPATGTCDDNSQAGASEMDGSSDRSSKLDLRAGHARVAAWVSRLAECATANCLCVGSMSQQDAEQVAEVVRTTLGPRGLLPGQQVRVGVLNLAAAAAAATVSTAPATVVGNISRHEQPGNSADAAGQLVEVPEGQAQQMEQGQVHAKRRRVGEDAAPGSGAAAEPQQQDKWLAGVEMTKQSSSLDSGTHPSPRQDSASTQATSMLRLSLPSPNTSNSINSSVLLIVQVCDAHGPPESPALLELCVQLAAKPAFAALRTRQQLGYSVHLAAHRLHHRLGLKVSVQSARFPCGTVREAILSFLRDFSETLAGG